MTTWDVRKTIGAIAVAAAVAGVGGAAIAAATDAGPHGMSGGMHGPPGGFGGPPPARHADTEPDALHGQYVVPDGHGGYSTLISQIGRITTISATNVVARSDDGFVQSYVVHEAGGDSAPPFAVGQQVVIDATLEGQTATVTSIHPPLTPGH
jgi:hypothetical protein